jgi:hypothetical protein
MVLFNIMLAFGTIGLLLIFLFHLFSWSFYWTVIILHLKLLLFVAILAVMAKRLFNKEI